MKYVFLIILLIIISISILFYYKIITPLEFPSKYFESDYLKWHFFTRDKNILNEFTKYYFFIKSIHLAGDFEEVKVVEIQTFVPCFIFKFYEIKGFTLQKSSYGIAYINNSIKIKYLNSIVPSFKKGEGGFGFIKTEPRINFKIRKNKYFEFESIVGAYSNTPLQVRNENFKIKNFDLEIYKASSPHFDLLFPKIEEIEVYYKGENGFFKIKEKGKEKTLKFGDLGAIQKLSKEEELSFYLRAKDINILKKFIKNPLFENLKEIEIKCFEEKNCEKCIGYFTIF